jgi:hypothetical protein
MAETTVVHLSRRNGLNGWAATVAALDLLSGALFGLLGLAGLQLFFSGGGLDLQQLGLSAAGAKAMQQFAQGWGLWIGVTMGLLGISYVLAGVFLFQNRDAGRGWSRAAFWLMAFLLLQFSIGAAGWLVVLVLGVFKMYALRRPSVIAALH